MLALRHSNRGPKKVMGGGGGGGGDTDQLQRGESDLISLAPEAGQTDEGCGT